jgi:hypothetical protein
VEESVICMRCYHLSKSFNVSSVPPLPYKKLNRLRRRSYPPISIFQKTPMPSLIVISRPTSTVDRLARFPKGNIRIYTHISTSQQRSKNHSSKHASPSLILGTNNTRRVVDMRARPRSRRRVALTRAASRVTNRPGDLLDQIALNNFQRAHLLAYAVRAVPTCLCPLRTAHITIGAAGAGLRGCLGGGGEEGQDLVGGPGRYFGCGGHPAGEVGFEGELVDVAEIVGLAGDFVPVERRCVSAGTGALEAEM